MFVSLYVLYLYLVFCWCTYRTSDLSFLWCLLTSQKTSAVSAPNAGLNSGPNFYCHWFFFWVHFDFSFHLTVPAFNLAFSFSSFFRRFIISLLTAEDSCLLTACPLPFYPWPVARIVGDTKKNLLFIRRGQISRIRQRRQRQPGHRLKQEAGTRLFGLICPRQCRRGGFGNKMLRECCAMRKRRSEKNTARTTHEVIYRGAGHSRCWTVYLPQQKLWNNWHCRSLYGLNQQWHVCRTAEAKRYPSTRHRYATYKPYVKPVSMHASACGHCKDSEKTSWLLPRLIDFRKEVLSQTILNHQNRFACLVSTAC